MYEQFYGLSAKPFQLKPDPSFFFDSKVHKRATAYLEYGLSHGEGFIVITGEVGAGKTTLVRNLFRNLQSDNIVAAQIANTHLNADDTLKMVTASFGLPYEDVDKATLLTNLEKFLRQCEQQGRRALLVVDEAQNLSPHTIEELRMLSNFQSADRSLLQTFLLGQPEFRETLLSEGMKQLQQRVIATYHLGPMDAPETRAYIEHRLHTVGWRENPTFSDDAFATIYDFTGGIPRKINTLCDRLMLFGFLEEIHAFTSAVVNEVISDIRKEFVQFDPKKEEKKLPAITRTEQPAEYIDDSLEDMDERIARMERSVTSVLDLLKQVLSLFSVKTYAKRKR